MKRRILIHILIFAVGVLFILSCTKRTIKYEYEITNNLECRVRVEIENLERDLYGNSHRDTKLIEPGAKVKGTWYKIDLNNKE
ncbi:MAG: hypothetical protein PSX36_13490 [bacterium]|nr:hypothetical protein [bacterium]